MGLINCHCEIARHRAFHPKRSSAQLRQGKEAQVCNVLHNSYELSCPEKFGLLPYNVTSRAVVLKVKPSQPQYYLGTLWKCKYLGPTTDSLN